MKNILMVQIRKYVDSGDITFGDMEQSQLFDRYILNNYPWMTNHIVWSKVNDARRINLDGVSQEGIAEFIRGTRLGKYNKVAIVYSASEEFLIAKLEFTIEKFDLLIRTIHDHCYFVGIIYQDDKYQLVNDDFVEYEFAGRHLLSGRI